MSRDSTDWYGRNARAYCEETLGANLELQHLRFLKHVKVCGRILDVGCGSARDSLYFHGLGYRVDARDCSAAMAAEATRLTGITVRVQDILDLDDCGSFDAVWACAVLLHLSEVDAAEAVRRVARSLAPGGSVYISVKRGAGEETIDGRKFKYWERDDLLAFVSLHGRMNPIDCWETQAPNRPSTTWINLIAKRE